MNKIPLLLPDGGMIAVEIADQITSAPESKNRPFGNFERLADKLLPERFEDAINLVRPAVQVIYSTIDTVVRGLEEVAIEFSIKFSASGGIIIASGSAEANLKICLKWKPKPP